MERKEAKQVLRLLCGADGGCSNCVGELFDGWNHVFPEHEAELIDSYDAEFKFKDGKEIL